MLPAAFEGLNKYSAGAVASSPQGFVKAVIELRNLQKHLATSEFPNLAAIDAMYEDLAETDNIKGTAAYESTCVICAGLPRNARLCVGKGGLLNCAQFSLMFNQPFSISRKLRKSVLAACKCLFGAGVDLLDAIDKVTGAEGGRQTNH